MTGSELARVRRSGTAGTRGRRAGAGGPALLEALEARALMTSVFSADEVYFAELVNRARANPQAEGVRLGINLANGLTLGEQARLVQQEPLALDLSLTLAARAHSLDMGVRGFFDHTNPSGFSPTQRVQAQGYAGTAGENIGAGYASIDALYQAWMAMPDERRNLLSLHAGFDSTYHYDQLGSGFDFDVTGASYTSYFTTNFGNPSAQARTQWLVGVVFGDADHDAFYSVGEGMASVRIDVFAGSSASGTPAATFTTDDAGNYQLPLNNGAYTVVFSQIGTDKSVTKHVTMAGENEKVDAMGSELVSPVTPPPPPPPPPSDDHANAGAWSSATVVPVDPENGNGAANGVLGNVSDSDLFKFTATVAGEASIGASRVSGGMTLRLRVYNAAFSLVATGEASGANSGATVSLVAGGVYYALVDRAGGSGSTAYVLLMEGPGPVDPDGGGGGGGSGNTIADALLAAPDQAMASTLSGGKSSVAFINQEGAPMFAARDANGVWTGTDLRAATGSPAVSGNLSSWVDGRDGLTYVAATSSAGVLVYKRAANGAWTYRNLTSEIHVSSPIVSGITAFVDGGGLTQIAGLTANGDLVTYWQTGAKLANGQWRYFFTDITTRDLARRGRPMPVLTSTFTNYVTQRNSLNIIGMDSAGNVYLFFRPGGGMATQLWNWTNLTASTHAAAFVGTPTAYETTSRIVQITGTDLGGNVWNISWKSGEGWRSSDVTSMIGGAPALMTTGLASYANRGGVGFTAGLTSEGELILYRYQFVNGMHKWTYASVSGAIANPPRLEGPVSVKFDNGAMLITATTEDGEAFRVAFNPGGSWVAESVSEILNG